MCACSPTSSTDGDAAARSTARCRVARREAEPELRVVLAGLHVLVGVRLDARSYPQQHRGHTTVLGIEGVEAIELVERVDDGAPDPCGAGHAQLFDALVVAVQHQAVGRERRRERDVQLAAGRDVEPQTLLIDEPHHRSA